MTRLVSHLVALLCALALTLAGCGREPGSGNVARDTPPPQVLIETSKGDITVELFAKAAPISVDNFLSYVRAGFYDGTIFHRVIPDFMIQGGGLLADLHEKPTHPPIPNEAGNGLKNLRGTLAMARTSDPHSASAQFFINVADNAFLDHRDKSVDGWGYAVFGKVIAGMEVVDAIAAMPRGAVGPHEDVPLTPVVIKRVTQTR